MIVFKNRIIRQWNGCGRLVLELELEDLNALAKFRMLPIVNRDINTAISIALEITSGSW